MCHPWAYCTRSEQRNPWIIRAPGLLPDCKCLKARMSSSCEAERRALHSQLQVIRNDKEHTAVLTKTKRRAAPLSLCQAAREAEPPSVSFAAGS